MNMRHLYQEWSFKLRFKAGLLYEKQSADESWHISYVVLIMLRLTFHTNLLINYFHGSLNPPVMNS